MSLLDDMKKVASKGFDEAYNVARHGKNPLDAAQDVKKHAEKVENKNKKK